MTRKIKYCFVCTEWGQDPIVGHAPWECPKGGSVYKIRERLKQINVCIACTIRGTAHSKGCNFDAIRHRNKAYDKCGRCGATDHVFWTCNGKPHPGSQYELQEKELEESHKDENYIKLQDDIEKATDNFRMNENQTDTASLKEEHKMFMKIQKNLEKVIEDKLENVYNNLDTINGTANFNSAEIGKLKVKTEFLYLENAQVGENQDIKSQTAKLYIEELESKVWEQENVIKRQRNETDLLIKENIKLNDNLKCLKIKNTEEISSLQQELNDRDNKINKFEKIVAINEQNLKNNEEVYTKYQQEVEHLFVVLRNIFPELEVNEKIDNTTFLKILEKSV